MEGDCNCSTYSRQIDQEGSLRTYKLITISTPATSVTDTFATSTVGLVEDHFELSELRDHTQDEKEKELEISEGDEVEECACGGKRL